MGTRADFYVGRGTEAEWLGSVAWDGNPESFPAIGEATDEATYRTAVATELGGRDDATTPDLGWPWPWDDSRTTDYAYAWDQGVMVTSFGTPWSNYEAITSEDVLPPSFPRLGDDAFPNMKAIRNVDYGKRSGLTVITIPRDVDGRRIDP